MSTSPWEVRLDRWLARLPAKRSSCSTSSNGRILGDVFTGVLRTDKNGLLHDNSPSNGRFSPAPPIAKTAGTFTFADLVQFAGQA